jgi:predicted metal-dependent hydrolase
MRINPQNEIVVSARIGIPLYEIDQFVSKNRDWIDKTLLKINARKEKESALKERCSNETLVVETENFIKYWQGIILTSDKFPTRVRFRKMKTRWGVCNIKTGVITINSELNKYPKVCLEYVIVHELSHLVHSAHNKNFWNLVEKHLPNYKQRIKLLSLKSV